MEAEPAPADADSPSSLSGVGLLAATQSCGPSLATLQELQRLPLFLVDTAGTGVSARELGLGAATQVQPTASAAGQLDAIIAASEGPTSVLDYIWRPPTPEQTPSSPPRTETAYSPSRFRGAATDKRIIFQEAARRKQQIDEDLSKHLRDMEREFDRQRATFQLQAEEHMRRAQLEIEAQRRVLRSNLFFEEQLQASPLARVSAAETMAAGQSIARRLESEAAAGSEAQFGDLERQAREALAKVRLHVPSAYGDVVCQPAGELGYQTVLGW